MIKAYKILYVSVMIAVVALMSGCTRNNGDIGNLFGRWKVDTLTADGVGLPLYGDDSADDAQLYAFWFQGSLVWIHTVYPHQDYITVKGMWTRTETRLLLNFSHTGNDGEMYYTPPAALHLVAHGVTPLTVESESSSRMHLWYVADSGIRYDYYLSKVY